MTNTSENILEKIPGEIICFFKTNLHERFRIDATQQYNISTSLSEKELSQMIVQLLATQNEEIDQIIPRFEFLINNEFLRGNIKSHLAKHNLDGEQLLTIHYTFALQQPQEKNNAQEEDWIKHITLAEKYSNTKKKGRPQSGLVVSLFNGELSFYEGVDLQFLARQRISEQSIRQSAVCENYLDDSDAQFLIYSACQDETLKVSSLTLPKTKNIDENKGKINNTVSCQVLAEGVGNNSSVECLDVNPLYPNIVACGLYNGVMKIFKIKKSIFGDAYRQTDNGKRVKLNQSSFQAYQEFDSLHKENITSIQWLAQDQLLTGSFDHHIKTYDTERYRVNVDISCKDSAVTCLAILNEHLVISGHEDAYIKTWDLRENGLGPNRVYKSHSIWISDVRALQNSEFIFLSTSYDHTVKIWDVRSSFPLYTLKTHHDKVFSAQWNGEGSIVAGGSDKLLSLHTIGSTV